MKLMYISLPILLTLIPNMSLAQSKAASSLSPKTAPILSCQKVGKMPLLSCATKGKLFWPGANGASGASSATQGIAASTGAVATASPLMSAVIGFVWLTTAVTSVVTDIGGPNSDSP